MHGSAAHKHSHAHHRPRGRRRLAIALILTFLYMVAEVVGGFLTNSLALLSDAGHMLTDVAALSLAMLALWFAARPVTLKKTYGYYRMEILAAFANGVTLAVISLIISYEAIGRMRAPPVVQGFQTLLIASGGLLINAAGAWLLREASKESLNLRGAFLHTLSDALGSVGAIAAGLLIWKWGWALADPIISICLCLLIISSSWLLIRDSVNILLEGVPPHISISELIAAMHEAPNVLDVHDLHVWTISSGKDALSAHVIIEPEASHKETLDRLQERLRSEFNIDHLTIQLELRDEDANEPKKLYQIARKNKSGPA